MNVAMKPFSFSLLVIVCLLFGAAQTLAVLITFTHTGVGSGTIDTHSFSDASFTITAVGDTVDRYSFSNGNPNTGYAIDHLTASISIVGVGTFNFTAGTRFFVSNTNQTVGFGRDNGWDLFDGPTSSAFSNWDMLSSVGTETGTAWLMQWSQSTPVTTDGGVLTFQNGSCSTTFTAVVPEPATWSLLLLGIVALLGGRRLRRSSL
jgi:hypothetical protein